MQMQITQIGPWLDAIYGVSCVDTILDMLLLMLIDFQPLRLMYLPVHADTCTVAQGCTLAERGTTLHF
jgi:hypothetical protein